MRSARLLHWLTLLVVSAARHSPSSLARPLAQWAVAAGLLSGAPLASQAAPLGNVGAAVRAVVTNPESLTCNLDNQSIKDGESSCQQLDEVVRWRAGRLLTIRQDWGGSASTGAAIWNGANVASWYLENRLGPAGMQGKSVVELGAGVGFTSLVANALGAAEVVVTDGNEDVLRLADVNIATNVDGAGGTGKGGEGKVGMGKVRTARLRWNSDDEKPLFLSSTQEPWDFLLASDVTYKKAAWADLAACIDHLSGPRTQAVVSMEPRNVGEVEGVLGEFERRGFVWREEALPLDRDSALCSPFCARLFVLSKAAL